jgi:hypothetical protein
MLTLKKQKQFNTVVLRVQHNDCGLWQLCAKTYVATVWVR